MLYALSVNGMDTSPGFLTVRVVCSAVYFAIILYNLVRIDERYKIIKHNTLLAATQIKYRLVNNLNWTEVCAFGLLFMLVCSISKGLALTLAILMFVQAGVLLLNIHQSHYNLKCFWL